MNEHPITVILPGGQARRLVAGKQRPDATLAEVLEEQGIPLNMRCEGRGLCRGCQVKVEENGQERALRACQHKAADLLPGIQRVVVPENSWRDHSLHGVSVFEIHASAIRPTSRTSGYGIAFDIGTTTLAAALWDFSRNECLAHESRPNPQARFGDNVVSRINFSIERENGSLLLQESLLRNGLLPMVKSLCRDAGIALADIAAATVSGNPTMLHTLAGASLAGLGKYPFQPAFLEERKLDAADLGFGHAFPVTLLPGLGPFVGSDVAVGALASGMVDHEGPSLLIDFGTNGEILLKSRDGYFATATAAGPAFEGGRLSCGAAARDGVISSMLRIDGRWEWTLSGQSQGDPNGISGAAYVDFMAIGRECGLLDAFGRMDRGCSGVHERRDGDDIDWAVDLAPSTWITEADVAELLQAKAAIAGGTATLLDLAGLVPSDLKEVLVAGGFGYHLNPGSATRIGLLPDVPVERIRMIGNASLGGASLLLNDPQHAGLHQLIERCQVIELNQISSFEDHFTDGLSLDYLA